MITSLEYSRDVFERMDSEFIENTVDIVARSPAALRSHG